MLTPATITVTFTANYSGPHRICWKVQGDTGPYVCTNIVTCAGGGNVCQAVVSIMVDPESCDPVTYEGYIQATCNAEGSSVGQVPWIVTFTPNPVCKGFTVTCNSSSCPEITADVMGIECNGTPRPAIDPMTGGQNFKICSLGMLSLPSQYTMVENDLCCYDCSSYDVTVTPAAPGGILDGTVLYYISCTTRQLTKQTFTGTSPVTVSGICAVTGSVSVANTLESTSTVTLVGPC